jgi:hypothetical protein
VDGRDSRGLGGGGDWGMARQITVLSLGAGVQSSTLLLMSCLGELPKLDAAIFADTGDEPETVYQHLAWLDAQAQRAGIPVYRVSAGNIREDILRAVRTGQPYFANPPFFTRGAAEQTIETLWGREVIRFEDHRGRLTRRCTQHYKILPIRRQVLALMSVLGASHVEQWFGISWDEIGRMKPSGVRYISHRWPLVERRMTRHECVQWLREHGFPEPPKSACVICPYHSDAYWRDMRDHRSEEWTRAVEVDAAIRRSLPGVRGEAFLHRSRVPLPLVELRSGTEDRQGDLFGEECMGMCGV